MIQPGFFDLEDRVHKIDKNGDPLAKINESVNWELFRPVLEKARDKGRQSSVGPKGRDVVLLFKILILQSLYNLSDDATGFQILDRHSFGPFLGLHISLLPGFHGLICKIPLMCPYPMLGLCPS